MNLSKCSWCNCMTNTIKDNNFDNDVLYRCGKCNAIKRRIKRKEASKQHE